MMFTTEKPRTHNPRGDGVRATGFIKSCYEAGVCRCQTPACPGCDWEERKTREAAEREAAQRGAIAPVQIEAWGHPVMSNKQIMAWLSLGAIVVVALVALFKGGW